MIIWKITETIPVRRIGEMASAVERLMVYGAISLPICPMNSMMPKEVAWMCCGKVSTTR